MDRRTANIRELIRHRERGQMAFAIMFGFLILFSLSAFGLDMGVWYADHRRAQNQAEAAALAGVNVLPQPEGPSGRQLATCDRPGQYEPRPQWLR
jgi:Flp pilus assembly protein TadG